MNSKKFFLVFVGMLILVLNVRAQNSYHGDEKPIHFGFSLGFNTMDFGIAPSNVADVSTLIPGFSVGIVSDLLISRYLNLRFTPTLHFGEREISYVNKTLAPIRVSSIPMSVPLYIKLSAERYGNLRPYLIGGGGVYFDLGRNADKPILLRSFDPFVEVGVGCDIYFSFFKLAPELKFALGFNNMLTPIDERNTGLLSDADKEYTKVLNKLTSRLITLTFNFE
ncbi:MAG: outer membrane beta-barrel protein [Paludibacter sp.]|nr:outer membrane beta-barrel protein [Paludibacter sp.]